MAEKSDKSTFVNRGRFPVNLILPGGNRVTVPPGKTITGPTKELMKYVPVIVPLGGNQSQPNRFRENVEQNQETNNQPVPSKTSPFARKAEETIAEGDNRNKQGPSLNPFSPSDLPPVVRGVDYEAPLTIDQVNADGFKWSKVKTRFLKAFAEENMLDLEPAEKNRSKMIKIIRESIGA